MDMSQYRELFLSETREHISNLNKLVVILEQEPDNRETIDALFREAHSIKGMAATMGYDRTAQLSHHLEDLLDGFRSTGEVPVPAIDYLLAGIDLLDGLLDDLQSNRPERAIDVFLREPLPVASVGEGVALEQSLAAADENDEGTAKGPGLASAQPAPAAEINEPAPAEDTDFFQVLVDLAEDTPASAARCILILRELEKAGDLISSKPELATLRGGAPCTRLQVWLRTSLAKGHIKEALLRVSSVASVRFIDDRRKRSERRGSDEGARTVRVRTDLLDQFVNLTGELLTRRNMLNRATLTRDWNGLNQALVQTGRLIDDLHHHVLQARLMPLENIAGRLPRIVRDLSRKTGKKVTLRLLGTDVGIDRMILEELTDPLVHLVRNAVDHGIEHEGTVTVSARREKGLILIEVADDGKGMDSAHLRRKAVERGLMTPAHADTLSDRDALMLVCLPGFSTAAEITDTSGRGVGMDVVKAAVGNLSGTLEIISTPDRGTRFQMRLPLSIAIIRILLISCGGRTLAIPLSRVLRTLDLTTGEIDNSGKQSAFRLDEESIPLYPLAEALGLTAGTAGETTWVVLTEIKGRRIGLRVDRFIGQREAFVKALGFPLNLLTGLSGATIEGDGQVVFIVDPQALFENLQLSTKP